jgi:hypothetical protein
MGYSRQSIALGLAMLGLVALEKGYVFKFVIFVALAGSFHKSALLILPIAGLATTRNRYWTVAWAGLIGIILFYLLLASDVDALYTNYVIADYQSKGALIRLSMNALPAAVFLIWRPRFSLAGTAAPVWTWFAIISLVLFALFFVVSASTALDRVALYMLPLQLLVSARLPDALGAKGWRSPAPTAAPFARKSHARRSTEGNLAPIMVAAILVYYGVVQFVWLNFADNAAYWLPYRFYPLESSF